jgi:hypothetical protein
MQASATLLLLLLGLIVKNPWVASAGVMAHIYSVGLAGWDEDEDLRVRFGDAWTTYRTNVRSWLPRFRPWHPPDDPPARLFVAQNCGMCSEVGRWFVGRGTRHLEILAAELHPSRRLTRITYQPGDGSAGVSGRSNRACARTRSRRVGVHRRSDATPDHLPVLTGVGGRVWWAGTENRRSGCPPPPRLRRVAQPHEGGKPDTTFGFRAASLTLRARAAGTRTTAR